MAGIKKKSSGGGGANWMDTYGDMVTLLLCFFVLLYSMSSIDQEKWMIIVQSFNKDALVSTDEYPRGPEGDDGKEGGDDMPMTQDDVDTAMDELLEYIQTQVASQSDSVSVSKGDGYVFISFENALFFDGDRSTLRSEGKAVLDALIPSLDIAAPYIDEMRVMGHTAQANPDRPNNTRTDTFLSSDRAAEVRVYLLEHSTELDPTRVKSEGMGQWLPVASNDTAEGRAQNRRVEIMISGMDIENRMAGNVADYYTETGQIDPNVEPILPDGETAADTGGEDAGGTEPAGPNIASGELIP